MPHERCQNAWQQLRDGEGFSPQMPHDGHPCTGRNRASALPALAGRKGRERCSALRPQRSWVPQAAPPWKGTFWGTHSTATRIPVHSPTDGAQRGQDWTLSRHIHVPAWSRNPRPGHSPGAQRSVVQPEPAQPVTPLCYGANPRGWLRCWTRVLSIPRKGHGTASAPRTGALAPRATHKPPSGPKAGAHAHCSAWA